MREWTTGDGRARHNCVAGGGHDGAVVKGVVPNKDLLPGDTFTHVEHDGVQDQQYNVTVPAGLQSGMEMPVTVSYNDEGKTGTFSVMATIPPGTEPLVPGDTFHYGDVHVTVPESAECGAR